jgi:hypothetical protein
VDRIQEGRRKGKRRKERGRRKITTYAEANMISKTLMLSLRSTMDLVMPTSALIF